MNKPTRGIGDKWIDVCRLLNGRGVEYLVVGGAAMALHGRMRATKDLDVLVPRDVENMRRLLEALEALPMGLARKLNAEAENEKVITIIGDDPRVDVLKAAGDLAYGDAVRWRRTATVDGVDIPYGRPARADPLQAERPGPGPGRCAGTGGGRSPTVEGAEVGPGDGEGQRAMKDSVRSQTPSATLGAR